MAGKERYPSLLKIIIAVETILKNGEKIGGWKIQEREGESPSLQEEHQKNNKNNNQENKKNENEGLTNL